MLRDPAFNLPIPPTRSAADLRIIHSCSVTVQAASKSRQLARRAGAATRRISLDQLPPHQTGEGRLRPWGVPMAAHRAGTSYARPAVQLWQETPTAAEISSPGGGAVDRDRVLGDQRPGCRGVAAGRGRGRGPPPGRRRRDRSSPRAMAGRGRNDVPARCSHRNSNAERQPAAAITDGCRCGPCRASPKPSGDNGWMMEVGAPAGTLTRPNKPSHRNDVNGNLAGEMAPGSPGPNARSAGPRDAATAAPVGTTALPVLGQRQTGRQRAYLKIQDGCDAHCTYCIIPRLRPSPWSKPVEVAVEEATRLVAAGHVEIVLTGIFLGAYGQPTALRRRQPRERGVTPLVGRLVEALCTRVPGLRRLRLSSLEPGDLTPDLAPRPPQPRPGRPALPPPAAERLRRAAPPDEPPVHANRLPPHARSRSAPRSTAPRLTTDVIVGFPGETDAEFDRTLEVVDAAGFIHVHAFSYSPRARHRRRTLATRLRAAGRSLTNDRSAANARWRTALRFGDSSSDSR